MGGSIKWPYNDSECLDADFFKVASDWSDVRMPHSDWLLQVVADHLVTSSGIRPLLHSFAVDVIMEEDTIKVARHHHSQDIITIVQGIIMESKSGRRAILADRVIDCTGDADIAHLAGAEYRVTDKKESQDHDESRYLYL